jgi:Protein of unknown function (DUF3309)
VVRTFLNPPFDPTDVVLQRSKRNERDTLSQCEERNFQVARKFPPLTTSKQAPSAGAEEGLMSIGTIILIILVIALLGGFSGLGGGPFYGTGYYGGGGLGLIIVILLVLLLLGRI